MTRLAFITDNSVIRKILASVGLAADAPAPHPPRSAEDLFGAAEAADALSNGRLMALNLFVGATSLPESPHPYQRTNHLAFRYTSPNQPPPLAIGLVVDDLTSLEPGVDFVVIEDSLGRPIAGSPFTGASLADHTVRVPRPTADSTWLSAPPQGARSCSCRAMRTWSARRAPG